eukprot:4621689-Lingulodinium_polyedra.AAC.1
MDHVGLGRRRIRRLEAPRWRALGSLWVAGPLPILTRRPGLSMELALRVHHTVPQPDLRPLRMRAAFARVAKT